MPNPQNIKPPKMGEVRNPNGRPLGSLNRSTIAKRVLSMTSIFSDDLFDKLKQKYPEISKQTTIEEMIILAQANKAIQKSDTQAATFLLDCVYGKANETVKVEADNKVIFEFVERPLPKDDSLDKDENIDEEN